MLVVGAPGPERRSKADGLTEILSRIVTLGRTSNNSTTSGIGGNLQSCSTDGEPAAVRPRSSALRRWPPRESAA